MARTRITNCHNCGTAIEVPLRGKVGLRYCSDDCRPTCRVEDCSKRAVASQGLCWGHYQRFLKYGDPTTPRRRPGPPKQPDVPCSVSDCEKPKASLGLCNGHASAWRRANNPRKCQVDGCEVPVHAQDLCMRHYIRVRKYGDPNGRAWPTSCPAGHEFTPETTRYVTDTRDASISRVCVLCHRSRQAKRRAISRGVDADLILTTELMARDGWECRLCGGAIPPEVAWPHPKFGTIDHRVPLARGGRHVWANVQAAHLRCNMSKNDRAPEECDPMAFARLWQSDI